MYPATKSVSREDRQLTVLATKGEGHSGSTVPVPKGHTYPNNSPIRALIRTAKLRKKERESKESPKGISLLGNL